MSAFPTRRIGLVANPSAGKGRAAAAAPQLTGMLRARGHEILDLSADSAGAALAKARAAVAAGSIDALAVLGGDGMAHLGVNACAGTEIPLAIVPAGTGNDIADSLGLARGNLLQAAAALDALQVRRIDAGRIVGGVDGDALGAGLGTSAARSWFGGSVYAGFDAVVNARANQWRWPPGQMRYNLAILRELPVFQAIPYVIETDEQHIETEAMLVVVANVRSYGGGMRVAPDALPDDGLLDVLILHRLPRHEFIRVFPTVFSGGHVGHPAVELLQARRVSLEAHGIPVFADGEPFTRLPVTVEVVPGAVTMVVA
ncbi:diacylglycerol/lipid kinase family protein [Nostocoides jenkinsii]|uniref:DAGKc domain-containing protein n=1 Tax=Nostocoides jenkinsii Ben 74 TaxID=1193518 RepID=A0A077MDS6_9MICO|nr:YegS/Rv2252/BmrU family lipid kinase [Tetrasphaera jenkinsii]CCI53097.1 conserved hypothetical protein [Tetrasphaera jenkinsii Ben 74]